ncbi:hypothetical protein [Breoghania sp. L-A4]|uniref:hypothetical protein n=1 Tax=Breoghania sp. L-A4 TaxID=2304600 RepID=UPI000E35D725|nr:hypothetical protein [Breoghania sp. L-A4]AXS41784.1 hypothetical protein D1F64_19435 [Breoghania sp. L-A4]
MSGPTLSSPRAGRPAGEASGTETTPGAAILAKDPAAPAMQRSSKALDAAMRANRDTVARPTKLPAIAAIIAALIIFGGLAAGVYSQRDAILAMIESIGSDVATAPDESVEVPQETPVAGVPGNGRQPKSDERLLSDDGSAAAPDARAVTTTRITPPSDAEGGVTSAAPSGNGARVVTPEAQPEAEAEAPQSETAQSGAPESAETPLAALPSIPGAEPPGQKEEGLQIAQRSILYEEGEGADASGSASQGQVVWSTLQEAAPGTEIIDTVLKANVVIPDRDITVNVTIRPNRDESLPASHLIEIRFTLPKEFEGKGVANVPGLIMKTTEEARGDALVGASVRVDSGFFWVALSSLEAEKQRNETLLRDRGWIDIPILYDSGKRAILTLEKGTAGDRAVQLALDAWTGG